MAEQRQRQDDVIMGQLLQKVQDSIELANERERAALERERRAIKWCEAHDATSIEWRKTIDTRLAPIEAWVSNANWSWKLFLGTVAFAGVLVKCWDWVRSHFK